MNIRFSVDEGELALTYIQKDPQLPTLIFLHDALGCTGTWKDFPKALAVKTGYNYLVYDRLGYGESSRDPNARTRKKNYLEVEAEVLLHIIQVLEVNKPLLFGHSDGGSIALLAAAKGSGLIQAIIVEAAHVFVEDVTLNGIKKVVEEYSNGILQEKLRKYHGVKVDEVFYSWSDTWLSASFRTWNIEAHLPNIHCPVLVIQGGQDEFGSLRQVETIQQGVNGEARIVVQPNIGHVPHRENKAITLKDSYEFFLQIKNHAK